MKTLYLLCTVGVSTCLGGTASAQITKVVNRAELGGTVPIDWKVFGRDGSFISTPVSHNFGAQTVSISSSSGGLVLRREGTTWHGDFRPGQYLMTQPYQSDSFVVSFSPPVSALGTQIDPGSQAGSTPPYTGRFTARLCLFGAHGNFLGLVQRASTADAAEDGSARFLGARSAGEPIGYVSLLVSGVTNGFTIEGDLAIDFMDIVPDTKPAANLPLMPQTTPSICR